MSYSAITDLQARVSEAKLIQLTDFNNTGLRQDDLITRALDSGAGMIDSYAGTRYTLPLTASQQIKDVELDIAVYKLYQGRQQVPEQIRQSYEDAIAFLKDVSTGKATLDQATIAQSTSGEAVIRDHDDDPYVFDDTVLEGF